MVNDIPTSRVSGLCCLPTKSGLAAAGWDVLIANSKIPKFRRLIDVTTSTTVSSGGLTDTSNWSIQFCLRRAFFLWCKIKKSLYLNQFWHYSLKSQLHIRAWLILFSQLLVDPGHQVVKNKEDQDHPHGDVTQDTAVVSSWSDHGGETFHTASEQACRTHEVWVLKERGDNSLIIHNKLT